MYIVIMSRVAVVKYFGDFLGEKFSVSVYENMIKAGIGFVAGNLSLNEYFKQLFPGGAVGIKTNCLTPFNATPLNLTEAFVNILRENAGYDENDLIIWERTNHELKKAGYTLNAASTGVRCLGTDVATIGYDRTFLNSGKVNSMVSKILTRMIEHNVNIPILKDHSIAGMSAGLKNMYGAIHNPNKYHDNNCSPYAANINNLTPIRDKHRLTIIDAVKVQYDNGPGYAPHSIDSYNSLIISEDPVAADCVALEILNRIRARNGKKSLKELGREVKYLDEAEKLGLGQANIAKIEIGVLAIAEDGSISEGKLF
ncbi:MAG: DUF362 domain-containing protein [candidate division Zixibacteria bacterium]